MVIVGTPNSGTYYERCLKLASRLKIIDKIIFNGHSKWEDMINHYNNAKVTLIPTIAKEGTSRSALESMACKTPCVSTNVGGLIDLPSKLCDANEKDLAKGLIEVVENYEAFSNNQFKIVTEKYNINEWNRNWAKLIKKLLNTYE